MRYFRVLIAILILAGLPLISWYVLRQGFDYHKSALEELKDLGKVSPALLTDSPAQKILSQKLSIAGRIHPQNQEDILTVFTKLNQQFESSGDAVFLIFYPSQYTAVQIQSMQRQYDLTVKNSVIFIPDTLAQNAYNLHTHCSDWPEQPCSVLAVADTSATIRQYYNLQEEGRLKRLIEHVAIILPRDPPRKPELRRQREK